MRTSNALGALDLPPRSRRIADMFSWKTGMQFRLTRYVILITYAYSMVESVQDALFSVHRADHSARGVSAQVERCH